MRGRALLALGLLAAAQGSQRDPTVAAPPPSPHAAAGVTFADVTASAGLDSFRHRAGSDLKPYLPETLGSGVALLDYDNDGWLDVYLVNSLSEDARRGAAPPNAAALFRNSGDGSFTDETARAGVANHRWGVGACAGDVNNDGWTDLYVTNFGQSRLYVNRGDGTFADSAASARVQADTWATGCAFGDYDGDGLLDLYVAAYVDFDWDNPPPPGGAAAGRVPGMGSLGSLEQAEPAKGAAYDPGLPACVYHGIPVACGPKGLAPAADRLFRNEGGGRFRDVSRQARLHEAEASYGLGVAWVDADDDGRPDLVVANDSMPNFLFHNRGDGTFAEIGVLSGLGTNGDGRDQAYMGVAVGDFNRNGRSDFFFTTFAGDNYTLHRNEGGLDFSDVTLQSGLLAATLPFLGWGAAFLDYDNDGWLDLLAANGHIFPQADGAAWGTSYRQRTLLFRNLRNGRFADVSGSAGAALAAPKSSRGAAVGDLFNDGTPDIVLNNLDGPPTVLRNRHAPDGAHWIAARLVGRPDRRTPADAIGAKVFCVADGLRQRGEVASGRSYLSQGDLRVHFGLGTTELVERLEVQWPNGEAEWFAPAGVDRVVVLEQGRGTPAP